MVRMRVIARERKREKEKREREREQEQEQEQEQDGKAHVRYIQAKPWYRSKSWDQQS